MAEIIQINENTWSIEDDFVRFFVLEGNEKALLIDSGFSTVNAKQIAESITKKPLLLLNTHGDGDHICGNGAFDSYYIGEDDYINLGLKERFPGSKPIFVQDGDEIDLGGRLLRLISIPGHTYGSIAILDVKARALFVGDTISTSIIYMFGFRRSMPEYIKSLEKLSVLKAEFDIMYSSHGELKLGPDAIEKVQIDLKNALDGKLPVKNEVIEGEEVTTHMGEFCGFYLPR